MQRLARLVGEVHEDEPRPHVAVHRARGRSRPCRGRRTRPPAARTCSAPSRSYRQPWYLHMNWRQRAARLLAREVGPHQLVAAVAADVVERADLAVHVAHDDDRRVGDRELLGEVAALPRELLDPADVQPRALEDRLALELVELGRDRVLVGHRRGAELGIVLGPAALGGLLDARHSYSSISERGGARRRRQVGVELRARSC